MHKKEETGPEIRHVFHGVHAAVQAVHVIGWRQENRGRCMPLEQAMKQESARENREVKIQATCNQGFFSDLVGTR